MMKVNLVKAKTVRDFASRYGAINSFEEWIKNTKQAKWNTPNDIKQTFASADILEEEGIE